MWPDFNEDSILMQKKLVKPLAIIIFILIGSVLVVRSLTRSETVADYAKNHPDEQVKVEIEAIPTPGPDVEAVSNDTKEDIDSNIGGDSADKNGGETANNSGENDSTGEDINDGKDAVENMEAFYHVDVPMEIREKMSGKSYASNIDESLVNYDCLQYVVLKYKDFNDETQIGEMICNKEIADDIVEIFEELYNADYQIERIRLIDEYDADDDLSMEANNTSCFNYRVVDHTTKLSQHAYGRAIDLNPFYNPYVQFRDGAEYVCPSMSVEYADRSSEFSYKIDENDLAYKLFKEHGFTWGGAWNSCKDYQHFEKRAK